MTTPRKVIRDRGDVDWSAAACLGTDVTVFFPPGADQEHGRRTHHIAAQIAEAVAICAGCPIAAGCLAYALDNGIEHGVWAGTTGRERRRIRRARREAV